MRQQLSSFIPALLALAEKRLPALTRLRQPESFPIALDRRRIYVLPTRFGLLLGLMLCVMLLGALNYNNNPALLLTCLLGGASFLSMFQGFRNLNGISLLAVHADPCFAGETLQMKWQFSASLRARFALCLDSSSLSHTIDLPADNDKFTITINIPALHRGWQGVGRWRLWTDYPLGLFWAWSYLHPTQRMLVYPRLESAGAPLPQHDSQAEQHLIRQSGDEYSNLRNYQPTDSVRLIAWKASARHDDLYVKELERHQGRELILDWNQLTGLESEQRISRLARWVCDAEATQLRYELRLPDNRLGPAHGPTHRHACLQALALLPGNFSA